MSQINIFEISLSKTFNQYYSIEYEHITVSFKLDLKELTAIILVITITITNNNDSKFTTFKSTN